MSNHVRDVHVTPIPFGTLRTAIDLPSPEGETFDHDLHGFCWCQPLVEHHFEGDLYIHRRSLDSPHIEVEA